MVIQAKFAPGIEMRLWISLTVALALTTVTTFSVQAANVSDLYGVWHESKKLCARGDYLLHIDKTGAAPYEEDCVLHSVTRTNGGFHFKQTCKYIDEDKKRRDLTLRMLNKNTIISGKLKMYRCIGF